MRLLILILVLIVSCQSQDKKGQTVVNENNQVTQKNMENEKNLVRLTCYLMTLDGEKEIYSIKNDSIYAFGEVEKLNTDTYKKINNIPKIVYNKDFKFGCGTCTDGVDYKFKFDFGNKQTTWEIEPGSKLPIETDNYFKVLINKYKSFVIN